MATKSLAQWCAEKNLTCIFSEIDSEKNKKCSFWYTPDRIEYNSPLKINWKCEKGHEWQCEVVGRTLFGLKCPVCNPNDIVLPIGTKYGCLTIIGDYNDYFVEVAEPEIQKLQKKREDFLNGIQKSSSNINSVEYYNSLIEFYCNRQLYKCKCRCGKIHYLDQFSFLEKRHRYCTKSVTKKGLEDEYLKRRVSNEPYSEEDILKWYCGLAVKAWKVKQQTYKANARKEYADNYNINFTGVIFESLKVLRCINDNYEEPYGYSDLRKKDAYYYKIYKLYKCRCYLCGKEHTIKCSQFHISPPTQYGETAYHGYWSGVQCDCHKISSFQWIVNKLLIENNVPYRVEYSFSDLYGIFGRNKLRFDFAIFNEDGSIKCLIECQGKQHYMPVEKFGGNKQYTIQLKNDKLKRDYAQKHNIPMIEISYKDKKYEKIKTILKNYKLI